MCRSLKSGEHRRCPSCSSYPAAARANGNRRQGRLARRKVVDHLTEQGLINTGKAALAAPPSVLPEFMAAMDIDPAVLGDTPMPGTGPGAADATPLIATAKAERAQQRAAQELAARRARAIATRKAPVRPTPTAVHAGAAARLAQALARTQGAALRKHGLKPAAVTVPNCRTNISVIEKWENHAEEVFAAQGTKAQCRVACAEAEMLCKGCPLLESCAQEAKASHYTGVAGGRIFVNGRHRLTPSNPARIVA
jgi:hypothetical protein